MPNRRVPRSRKIGGISVRHTRSPTRFAGFVKSPGKSIDQNRWQESNSPSMISLKKKKSKTHGLIFVKKGERIVYHLPHDLMHLFQLDMHARARVPIKPIHDLSVIGESLIKKMQNSVQYQSGRRIAQQTYGNTVGFQLTRDFLQNKSHRLFYEMDYEFTQDMMLQFPTRIAAMNAIRKLYATPKMATVLRRMNRGRQGGFIQVQKKKDIERIIQFLEQEAKQYRK